MWELRGYDVIRSRKAKPGKQWAQENDSLFGALFPSRVKLAVLYT